MRSQPPSQTLPAPPRLEPGETVRTPSGRFATVIAVYPGETLIEWEDGETARFRSHLLRGMP